MNPHPRKLSDVRNDVRMFCHVSKPAAGDLRTAATHLAGRLPNALRRQGVREATAEEMARTLEQMLKNLAAAQDQVTRRGQLVLDYLDQISSKRPARISQDAIID